MHRTEAFIKYLFAFIHVVHRHIVTSFRILELKMIDDTLDNY